MQKVGESYWIIVVDTELNSVGGGNYLIDRQSDVDNKNVACIRIYLKRVGILITAHISNRKTCILS